MIAGGWAAPGEACDPAHGVHRSCLTSSRAPVSNACAVAGPDASPSRGRRHAAIARRPGRHVSPARTCSRRPRRAAGAARETRGQGTVEYVALILLVALVMAGVVAAMKGFRTDEGKELGDVILEQDQAGGHGACSSEPRRRGAGDGRRAGRLPSAVPPFRPVARDPRELPVAMFDSGVGGLTVLHECLVSLPEEDFLYLGDTARFPYGDRSPDELRRVRAPARRGPGRARRQAARGGLQLGHRGGAARRCARSSRAATPVVGVVSPEARLAARATRNGRVGLIATPATVASGAYARALGRGGSRRPSSTRWPPPSWRR